MQILYPTSFKLSFCAYFTLFPSCWLFTRFIIKILSSKKQIILTLLHCNFSQQEKDKWPIGISLSQHIHAESDTAALLSWTTVTELHARHALPLWLSLGICQDLVKLALLLLHVADVGSLAVQGNGQILHLENHRASHFNCNPQFTDHLNVLGFTCVCWKDWTLYIVSRRVMSFRPKTKHSIFTHSLPPPKKPRVLDKKTQTQTTPTKSDICKCYVPYSGLMTHFTIAGWLTAKNNIKNW